MAFVNDYLLKVDIKRRLANIVPTFAQGETSRLRFKIYDNNVLYDLTDFTRAEIIHKLPSGDSFSSDASLVNGEIIYDYPTKIELGEVGKVEVSLVIYSDKTSVSIHPFTIFVYDNFKGENLSYVSVLQELIGEVQYLEAQVQQAIGEVNQLKTDLDALIDDVESNEVTRQTNETTRQSNESVRESNELSRIAEESIRNTTFNNKISEITTKINDFSNAESTRESNELTRITNESLREVAYNNASDIINDGLSLLNDLESIGEFDLATAYKKNNLVLDNGSTWIALQDTQNNPLPTGLDTENIYWRLFARKGLDGTGIGTVTSVNGVNPNMNGNVQLTAIDISAVASSEKGVANGIATLNSEGKVVDAQGNEVEGKVKTVNTKSPDVNGDITLTASDVSAYTTTETDTVISNQISLLSDEISNSLTTLQTDINEHEAENNTNAHTIDNIVGLREAILNAGISETTESITYYVDGTNGNDGNDGLTSVTAFKTIQKAVDSLPFILNHSVIIDIANGYYDETVTINNKVFCRGVSLKGNTDTKMKYVNIYNSNNIGLIDLIFENRTGILIHSSNVHASRIKFNGEVASQNGFWVQNKSKITIKDLVANKCTYIVLATGFSEVAIYSGDYTGSNNTKGLEARENAIIYKQTSWNITATTAETTSDGGRILA